jgi:thiamine biosynthesis lipoprotein
MTSSTHSFSHEAMTTVFEVIVAGQEREYARQASAAAFREIDRIEKLLNQFDAGSDAGQVNLLEPGEKVRVAIETIECAEQAVWAHGATGGLFDPTVGSGFQGLEVDRENFSIGWSAQAGKPAPRLDLGGIGKGFAIDKAAEVLAEWDVKEAVINGGTSTVLAVGRKWKLGVGEPWKPQTLLLEDRALSGSGTEVKGAHIINPQTGKPARRHLAAWAVHPSAAVSDALSTAFMMMEKEKIEQLCAKNKGTLAFVVEQNGVLVEIGH